MNNLYQNKNTVYRDKIIFQIPNFDIKVIYLSLINYLSNVLLVCFIFVSVHIFLGILRKKYNDKILCNLIRQEARDHKIYSEMTCTEMTCMIYILTVYAEFYLKNCLFI